MLGNRYGLIPRRKWYLYILVKASTLVISIPE